ncbi:hypothetical protein [Chryseobacterium sp. AG844]|uniref:hypothetical protein n=1 Tax=Chryseobacterium sp. AG844 TaxID=2183998 RepID=UPI0011B24515|nr:hypothetical protein [Chryseobacterium sp. AG844]
MKNTSVKTLKLSQISHSKLHNQNYTHVHRQNVVLRSALLHYAQSPSVPIIWDYVKCFPLLRGNHCASIALRSQNEISAEKPLKDITKNNLQWEKECGFVEKSEAESTHSFSHKSTFTTPPITKQLKIYSIFFLNNLQMILFFQLK